MSTTENAELRQQTLLGVGYALLAYGAWGLMPLYWKLVASVPAVQMVAHRVVWAVPVLLLLVAMRGRGPDLRAALFSGRDLRRLLLTAALISGNWLVFIWAVAHEHVLEVSLGYFINPLVNIGMGMVLLGESLRTKQWVAVLLAACGVLWLTLGLGSFPWISLVLAGSFACYGFLRKTAAVDGLIGLTVETLLLLPIALGYLLWSRYLGTSVFLAGDPGLSVLIIAAGLVTAFPLLWFANAARRLRYATVGFFQYLAPSLHLLLAVWVFGEAFTDAHAVAFGLIWAALGLYSLDALLALRGRPKAMSVQ